MKFSRVLLCLSFTRLLVFCHSFKSRKVLEQTECQSHRWPDNATDFFQSLCCFPADLSKNLVSYVDRLDAVEIRSISWRRKNQPTSCVTFVCTSAQESGSPGRQGMSFHARLFHFAFRVIARASVGRTTCSQPCQVDPKNPGGVSQVPGLFCSLETVSSCSRSQDDAGRSTPGGNGG